MNQKQLCFDPGGKKTLFFGSNLHPPKKKATRQKRFQQGKKGLKSNIHRPGETGILTNSKPSKASSLKQ